MIYEVRQNYEGKFYYQILGDTVGPFDTENEAREEGAAVLKLVEGQKPTTNTGKPTCPECGDSRVHIEGWHCDVCGIPFLDSHVGCA